MRHCSCDNPDGVHRLGCLAGKVEPWWYETKIAKHEAEIERLTAINAELLAACHDADRMYSELAVLASKGQPAMVPAMIVMRLKAAIANA